MVFQSTLRVFPMDWRRLCARSIPFASCNRFADSFKGSKTAVSALTSQLDGLASSAIGLLKKFAFARKTRGKLQSPAALEGQASAQAGLPKAATQNANFKGLAASQFLLFTLAISWDALRMLESTSLRRLCQDAYGALSLHAPQRLFS